MKKSTIKKSLLIFLDVLVFVFLVFLIKFKSPVSVFGLLASVVTPTSSTPITAEPEFSLPGTSTRIDVSKTFSGDTSFPFGGLPAIYGLSAYGNVKFTGDNSYARIILITDKGEKLVAEFYPLIFEDMQVNDFSVCEETCALNGEIPKEIKVEVKNATLTINSIYVIDSYKKVAKAVKDKGVNTYNAEIKNKQNKNKVKTINAMATKKHKAWVAGETGVSSLSYAEKKKLYGQSKFPAGIEYYAGGILDTSVTTSTTSTAPGATSAFTGLWDWRNRHGINWITPVKNQGACGSCWAFAATGALEAEVNLYFNQNINLDLSEQDMLSCSGAGTCSGGYPSVALSYAANTGIVDEAAFPYTATNSMCQNKSSSPAQLIKNAGKIDFGTTPYTVSEDNLKKMLMQYGPLSGGLLDWSHAMTLVGWKVVNEGDRFFYRNLNKSTIWYTVPTGSPLVGKTVWIFKNSWGNTWGDGGYVYVETDISNFSWTHALKNPSQSLKQTYTVKCVDSDQDGYYWWGLGAKPTSCPSTANTLEDGDDSNARLGPVDDYGNFTNIDTTPTPEPTPTPTPTPEPTPTPTPTPTPEPTPEPIPTPTPVVGGNISISSYPTGANVYIDGVSSGVTPSYVSNIAPGTYNVKVSKSGYQSYTASIGVTSGNTSNINTTLIKNSTKKK